MKNVYEKLCELGFDDYRNVILKHIDWSKINKRVSGKPQMFDDPGTLNIIGIDCDTNGNEKDDEIEFNQGRYKDFLVLIYNKPGDYCDIVILEVTLDPETDKFGRMNIMPGSYDAYCMGIHGVSSGLTSVNVPGHGTFPRWSIRQDRNKIYVARTDGHSKVIKLEWSWSYSNIHNPGKSAGCTVTKTNLIWFEKLLPYIRDLKNDCFAASNYNQLTYNVINHKQLEGYLGEELRKVEKAEAIGGADGLEVTIESKKAKKATRSKT